MDELQIYGRVFCNRSQNDPEKYVEQSPEQGLNRVINLKTLYKLPTSQHINLPRTIEHFPCSTSDLSKKHLVDHVINKLST